MRTVITNEIANTVEDMITHKYMTYDDIASKLNINSCTIYRFAKKHNLKRDYDNKALLEDLHHNQKMTKLGIAEKFNICPATINNMFKKHKIVTDKTIGIESKRSYTCDYNFFSSIDTEEKAYWLGFIIADGSIEDRKDRQDTYRLVIRLQENDRVHLEKFNSSIKGDFPINLSITSIRGKYHKVNTLRVNSSEMCKDLISMGILPRKTCKEIIPNIPKELAKHLIRGVFDGDGCFSYSYKLDRNIPTSSFNLCGSREVIEFCIDHLSKELNINKPSVREREIGLCTSTIGGNIQVKAIMDYLYKDSSLFLDRKKKMYNDFVTEYNHYLVKIQSDRHAKA